jgi:hypothetical protein
MIDPKLNKLPEETKGKPKTDDLEEQEASNRARRSRGLSINETVASNANLSVGSRGVDVSGVRSGAGAGAGMTMTTPGSAAESPAPNIVPGATATGTTPRGEASRQQVPTMRMDEEGPTREEIAARAYRCWQERGCPEGSAEEDWCRAEEELRGEGRTLKSRSASAS